MLGPERQGYIARRVETESSVSTIELARALHVSPETIRRDLIALEERGVLLRVYGGAVAPSRQRSSEPPYLQRMSLAADAKQRIGEVAAGLASAGEAVFIDVGTTAHQVARALAGSFRGTVVTHSVLAATELIQAPSIELLMAPGRLRRGEWSLTGTSTNAFLGRIHFDVAFLSCGGVDASAGPTDFDLDDVEVKRTVARNSRRALILADSTKYGAVGRYTIGDWHDVHGLVTDSPPPASLAGAIRAAGGSVHTPSADPPRRDPST